MTETTYTCDHTCLEILEKDYKNTFGIKMPNDIKWFAQSLCKFFNGHSLLASESLIEASRKKIKLDQLETEFDPLTLAEKALLISGLQIGDSKEEIARSIEKHRQTEASKNSTNADNTPRQKRTD